MIGGRTIHLCPAERSFRGAVEHRSLPPHATSCASTESPKPRLLRGISFSISRTHAVRFSRIESSLMLISIDAEAGLSAAAGTPRCRACSPPTWRASRCPLEAVAARSPSVPCSIAHTGAAAVWRPARCGTHFGAAATKKCSVAAGGCTPRPRSRYARCEREPCRGMRSMDGETHVAPPMMLGRRLILSNGCGSGYKASRAGTTPSSSLSLSSSPATPHWRTPGGLGPATAFPATWSAG